MLISAEKSNGTRPVSLARTSEPAAACLPSRCSFLLCRLCIGIGLLLPFLPSPVRQPPAKGLCAGVFVVLLCLCFFSPFLSPLLRISVPVIKTRKSDTRLRKRIARAHGHCQYYGAEGTAFARRWTPARRLLLCLCRLVLAFLCFSRRAWREAQTAGRDWPAVALPCLPPATARRRTFRRWGCRGRRWVMASR